MARQALATLYRPQKFDDVCAQDAVKIILQEQIRTKTFKHAYLFVGASGCGKTTCARIMAAEINNGEGHPIELDAASNSGVDNIRVIIDDSKKKSLDSEYKVYIVDECHMLSTSAWNALLKLLEEPPKFTIYIFCTTNPERIPETILNRVQRYDFTKIPTKMIESKLRYICEQENIKADSEALSFIAKTAEGGMRTAIAYLDKCASLGVSLTIESVVESLGIADYSTFFSLTEKLDLHLVEEAVEIVEKVFNSGKDLKTFCRDYLRFMVDVCKVKLFGNFDYVGIPRTAEYEELLKEFKQDNCFYIMELFKSINSTIRYSTDVRYDVESILLSEVSRNDRAGKES